MRDSALPGPSRIAHFTDTWLPRRDGVVTSLQTLDRQLRAAGRQSLVVVPRHRDAVAEPGQSLHTLRSLPCGVGQLRLAPLPGRRHTDAIAGWEPDLVHVHTVGPIGLLGVYAATRLGVPLVHTYHTDLHAYADAYRVPTRALQLAVAAYRRRLAPGGRPAMRTVGDNPRRALVDEGLRLLFGQSDAVVLPTRAILDRVRLPVPADRLHVLPTGVEGRTVRSSEVMAFRQRHGVSTRDRLVLSVGRVTAEKGIDLLLPAFARVLAAEPRARLVLVGTVYDREALSAALRASGLGRRVVLAGELAPQRVAAAYAAAVQSGGVLAFASRTDTQGLVLSEAAHAGLPCVMVDAELLAAGPLAGAALCAPATTAGFGAAIERLLANPVLAGALADRARRAVLAHTPQAYVTSMLSIYAAAAGVRDRMAA
ncbi:glycosyltransferase family 4 protein [Fodinicola feengrottensis]|uniref:Glycosyltransferase family 4 protein n=1 Tax=Fodinicola feengrottensis TaxID=435914 RepID=A0ABN2HEL9_9ACTN